MTENEYKRLLQGIDCKNKIKNIEFTIEKFNTLRDNEDYDFVVGFNGKHISSGFQIDFNHFDDNFHRKIVDKLIEMLNEELINIKHQFDQI